jgi:hypothetical protein
MIFVISTSTAEPDGKNDFNHPVPAILVYAAGSNARVSSGV